MIIIDDFLDNATFQTLQAFLLGMDFPWFYIPTVSLPPGKFGINDSNAKETFGYNHVVYDHETNRESYVFKSMPIVLETFEKKLNIKIKKLLRIGIGLKNPKLGFSDSNYNLPHVDYMIPHSTLILYMNDSDGDTRIFEQKYLGDEVEPTEFTVKARVTPKANRLLYLRNGWDYHTAANPINTDRRIVININVQA
jgi:hypothetical protein